MRRLGASSNSGPAPTRGRSNSGPLELGAGSKLRSVPTARLFDGSMHRWMVSGLGWHRRSGGCSRVSDGGGFLMSWVPGEAVCWFVRRTAEQAKPAQRESAQGQPKRRFPLSTLRVLGWAPAAPADGCVRHPSNWGTHSGHLDSSGNNCRPSGPYRNSQHNGASPRGPSTKGSQHARSGTLIQRPCRRWPDESGPGPESGSGSPGPRVRDRVRVPGPSPRVRDRVRVLVRARSELEW